MKISVKMLNNFKMKQKFSEAKAIPNFRLIIFDMIFLFKGCFKGKAIQSSNPEVLCLHEEVRVPWRGQEQQDLQPVRSQQVAGPGEAGQAPGSAG